MCGINVIFVYAKGNFSAFDILVKVFNEDKIYWE
jgi:hypothetical protein